MEDIKRKNGCQNVPGFVGLWVARVEDVAGINFVDDNKKEVTFNPLMDWAVIDADKLELLSSFEDRRFSTSVSGSVNATNNQQEANLKKMCQGRFIVRLKDRNGQCWLVGDITNPLRFSFEHYGTAAAAGEHTYRIRFEHYSTEGAFLTY